MSIKNFLIALSLLLFFNSTIAQKKHDMYFFKNNGKAIISGDSADYVRIISEPDSGEGILLNIQEYYKNGKIKLSGKTATTDGSKLTGACISYYPSGKRQRIATYDKYGMITGDIYDYYPNGKLYAYRQYPVSELNQLNLIMGTPANILIKTCNDSTGKALAVDGYGTCIIYAENRYGIDFKTRIEEGHIRNSIKEGTWKGRYIDKNDTLTYTEIFNEGRLLWGKSKGLDGQTFRYSTRLIKPQFSEKELEPAKFIEQKIQYPEKAKELNIQGFVDLLVTIESDGTLTNFKIVQDPGGGLGDEALRVMKLSPKWVPGKICGKPTSIECTIQIPYSLK